MGEQEIEAYLERIRAPHPQRADLSALRTLHRAHLASVPFENIDIRSGVPIALDLDRLFDKVVLRRRGGFCYELNGLFAELLRRSGFQVDLVEGRVYHHRRKAYGPPFDHMALLVQVPEGTYLADVGFGDLFLEPMPFADGARVDEGERSYVLEASSDGLYDLFRLQKGARVPNYRFHPTPHPFTAFEDMCRYHQTSPSSHFTQRTLCTMALPDGRITVTDHRLIRTSNGNRSEQALDRKGFEQALQDHFGLTVPGGAIARG
ncbi:MAG: arylamine N-acetyltransferase [Flavobacteriales bacterium]|nr:arylamine N-acetyltransferase [Flavobacteriales bacterium]